ncbi:MAG TPA: hypothetical protein VK698_20550 [Kofleriaceae bacterium]|nr:hypothetical protein [Kofleriaceae bacterium]
MPWNRIAVAAASALIGLVCACSGSCHSQRTGKDGLTEPARLCRSGPTDACRSAAEVEKWLERSDIEILRSTPTPAGVQGARVLTLRLADEPHAVFRAKWRAHSTTTSRNSPRRELAAYAVQKLFLEPDEYVAPPTAPHCFPLDEYRAAVDRKAKPTFPETRCVYGILSYWLEDVQPLGDAEKAGWFDGEHAHALDRALFEKNTGYRDSIATVNLFTYLIAHADSHARNFLITRDRAAPFVYSVDNSLSLGLARNANLPDRSDWSRIRVPALPRSRIERLRRIGDRVDRLRSVAELERKDRGLVVVEPSIDAPPSDGMDWKDSRLRVGLTADEIEGVRDRVARLLERVDRGEIRVY